MQEQQLLYISGITACIGLVLLYLLLQAQDFKSNYLSYLTEENTNLKGTVVNVQHYPTSTRITLKIIEEIPLLVFDNISIKKGQNVEVKGSVDENTLLVESLRVVTS